MKTVATIIVWVLHCLCTWFFILTFGDIYLVYSRVINLGAGFALLAFCIVNIFYGFASAYHKAFTLVALSSVAWGFLLMLVYYLFGMPDYKWTFCTFSLVELTTACFILHSGNKHGLFDNENT